MNLPSIIILLLVALAVIAAARHLRRSDRHSACGGNCDGCQGCELMKYKDGLKGVNTKR